MIEKEAPEELPSPEASAEGEEHTPSHDERETGEPLQEEFDEAAYEKQASEDLAALQAIAPETAGLRHLGELPGAVRFAELRALGLTPEEAYLAIGGKMAPAARSATRDNRAHLRSAVPIGGASGTPGMNAGDLEAARRIFTGLSDREIVSLYRRVNA